MTRRCARGFTLIELMVALMVMAVLSLMAWRGLDGMARAREVTQTRADTLQALQSGLAQWGSDLDALADVSVFAVGGTVPTAIDWNGQTLRLIRVVQVSGPNGVSLPALRVVAWSRGQQASRPYWLRWQSDPLTTRSAVQAAWLQAAQWAQTPNPALQSRELAVVPLQDWQVFYFRADTWSNPLSSNDVVGKSPDGVRLVLTLPGDSPLAGTLVRDWIRPQIAGNKS